MSTDGLQLFPFKLFAVRADANRKSLIPLTLLLLRFDVPISSWFDPLLRLPQLGVNVNYWIKYLINITNYFSSDKISPNYFSKNYLKFTWAKQQFIRTMAKNTTNTWANCDAILEASMGNLCLIRNVMSFADFIYSTRVRKMVFLWGFYDAIFGFMLHDDEWMNCSSWTSITSLG